MADLMACGELQSDAAEAEGPVRSAR
jgi:hypothetical protein